MECSIREYSYIVGFGKNKKKYTVNFDLSIVTDENGHSFLPENKVRGNISNYYQIENTFSYDQSARGETKDGYDMLVKPSAPPRTTIHEIGHTIGLGEFNGGVMESGGDGAAISASNIVTILENSGFRCYGTWSGSVPTSTPSAQAYHGHWGWNCTGRFKKNIFKKTIK